MKSSTSDQAHLGFLGVGAMGSRGTSKIGSKEYDVDIPNAAPHLEVITAQNAALSAEVTAVNILGRRMASAVLLIEAMGGVWERSELPQRPECCGKLPVGGN
jgi:hypothetical protein